MTIRHMCIACCIPNATNTYSGCVILMPFPPQQWLHESALVLHDTYIASLVVSQLCMWNEWMNEWMGFKSLVSIHITSAHTFKSCNKCWGQCSVEFTEEFMSGCYDSLQTLCSRSSHFPAHVIIIGVFIIVIIIDLFLSLHHNSIFTFISLIIVIVGIKGNVCQAQFCYLEHIKNDMWTPCCCISLQTAHSLS